MQYFPVFITLCVYGYRLNMPTKARNKLNLVFVSKTSFRFAMI